MTEETKRIQDALNKVGTAPRLDVDGQRGPLTKEAVRQFQQKQGLAVDGVVGPDTDAALTEALVVRRLRLWISAIVFAALGVGAWVLYNMNTLFR